MERNPPVLIRVMEGNLPAFRRNLKFKKGRKNIDRNKNLQQKVFPTNLKVKLWL